MVALPAIDVHQKTIAVTPSAVGVEFGFGEDDGGCWVDASEAHAKCPAMAAIIEKRPIEKMRGRFPGKILGVADCYLSPAQRALSAKIHLELNPGSAGIVRQDAPGMKSWERLYGTSMSTMSRRRLPCNAPRPFQAKSAAQVITTFYQYEIVKQRTTIHKLYDSGYFKDHQTLGWKLVDADGKKARYHFSASFGMRSVHELYATFVLQNDRKSHYVQGNDMYYSEVSTDEWETSEMAKRRLFKRDCDFYSEEFKMFEYGAYTHSLVIRAGSTLSNCVFGVGARYFQENDFFSKMEDMVDSESGKQLVDAIGDHDNRIINNTFARIDMLFVRTCKPPQNLTGMVNGVMDRVIFSDNLKDVTYPGEMFVKDMCNMYAYVNVDPLKTKYDEAVMRTMVNQPWFNLNDQTGDHKYGIYHNPALAAYLLHELTFAILPVLNHDQSGTMHDELGFFKKIEGGAVWAFQEQSEVQIITDNYEFACGRNYMDYLDGGLTVVGRKRLHNMQIIAVTPLKYTLTKALEVEDMTFEIPVIKPSIMSELGLPNLTTESVKLNKQLLNRLLNNNLTGKVGKDAMTMYGMALSWYSYNKKGVELANTTVDPMTVKTHVYVARVLLYRRKISEMIEELTFGNGLTKVAISLLSAMFTVACDARDLQDVDIESLRVIFDIIKQPTFKTSAGAILENWASIDVWSATTNIEVINSGQLRVCFHHVCCSAELTPHLCSCCGSYTATHVDGTCECCKGNAIKCYHACDEGNHNNDGIPCTCCGKPTNLGVCECCTIRPKIKLLLHDESEETAGKVIREHKAKYRTKHDNKKGRPIANDDNDIGEIGQPRDQSTLKPLTALESASQRRASPHFIPPDLTIVELDRFLGTNEVAILTGQIQGDELRALPKEPFSNIPFIIKRHPIETLNNFVVSDVIDITTTDCGVDCLKHYIGLDFSSLQLKTTTRKTKGLSEIDLINMLSTYNINSALITLAGVKLTRVNDDPSFAVIVHVSVLNKDAINHWQVAKLQRVKYQDNAMWASANHDVNQHNEASLSLAKVKYEALSNRAKLYISHFLNVNSDLRVSFPLELPAVIQLRNKYWLSNNALHEHEPSRGHFHILLSDWAVEPLSLAFSFKEGTHTSVPEKLNTIWDISERNAFDLPYHFRNAVRDICLSIVKMLQEPLVYCARYRRTIHVAAKVKTIDFSDTKLKNGDLIFIKDGNNWAPRMCKLQGGSLVVDFPTATGYNLVNILIPKSSFASKLMRICAILSCSTDSKQLETLVKNSKVTVGPGGSGKSTMIGAFVKTCDDKQRISITACTTGGVKSLNSKLPPATTAVSFEKRSMDATKHTIVIVDEASLLRPWELALVCDSTTTQLQLYGDTTQIAVIDFYISGGRRLNTSAMTLGLMKSGDITELTKTYRVGEPLASELKKHPAFRNLETAADHVTEFSVHNLNAWQPEEIMRLISGCTVVLPFYNDHVKLVRSSYLGVATKHIGTVHSYQGLETGAVAVIQANMGDADVHLQLGQTVSAVMRATRKLVWISINCFDTMTPLHERLGTRIGSKVIMYQSIANQEVANEIYGNYMSRTNARSKELDETNQCHTNTTGDKQTNLKLHKLKFDTFNFVQFSDLVRTHTRIVKITMSKPDKNTLVLEFKALGKTNNITFQRDGTYTTDLPAQYRGHVLDAVALCNDGDGTCDEVLFLNKDCIYRVRLLSYITKVRAASNKKTTLKGDLEGFELEIIGNHCAACCPLTFKHKNSTTTITKDYLTDGARSILGAHKEHIKQVLESKSVWNIWDAHFDEPSLGQVILTERISTAITDVSHHKVSYGHLMWYQKYDNLNLQLEIKNQFGMIIDVTNYDNMSWYPIMNKQIHRQVSRIVDGKRIYESDFMRKYKFNDLILQSLCDMHEHYKTKKIPQLISHVYTKYVGADDRLPGMVQSMDWHSKNETPAYYNLVERLGVMRIKALKYQPKQVYVPAEVHNCIRTMFGDKSFSSNNRNTLADPAVAAADCYVTDLTTATHKNDIVNCKLHTTYATYAAGLKAKVSAWQHDDSTKVSFQLEDSIYNQMLELHMAHLTFDTPEYNELKNELSTRSIWHGEHTDANVLVSGPSIATVGRSQWSSLILRYDVIYFWMPISRFKTHGKIFYRMRNGNSVFACDEDVHQCIEHGSDLAFDGIDGQMTTKIHSIRQLSEIVIYKIDKRQNNTHWLKPINYTSVDMNIEVPTILIDPEIAIKERQLIKSDVLKINSHVLANLRRRLLRPGTTYQDLLVQARTLINTVQFSTHKASSKYDCTVADVLRTAKLAWLIHANENSKLQLLNDEDSLLGNIKIAGLTAIIKLLRPYVPQITTDEIKSLFNEHVPIEPFKVMFSKFVDNLQILSPLTLNNDRQLITRPGFGVRFGLNSHTWPVGFMTVKSLSTKLYRFGDCNSCMQRHMTIFLGNVKVSSVTTAEIPSDGTIIKHRLCTHHALNPTITVGTNLKGESNIQIIPFGYAEHINTNNCFYIPGGFTTNYHESQVVEYPRDFLKRTYSVSDSFSYCHFKCAITDIRFAGILDNCRDCEIHLPESLDDNVMLRCPVGSGNRFYRVEEDRTYCLNFDTPANFSNQNDQVLNKFLYVKGWRSLPKVKETKQLLHMCPSAEPARAIKQTLTGDWLKILTEKLEDTATIDQIAFSPSEVTLDNSMLEHLESGAFYLEDSREHSCGFSDGHYNYWPWLHCIPNTLFDQPFLETKNGVLIVKATNDRIATDRTIDYTLSPRDACEISVETDYLEEIDVLAKQTYVHNRDKRENVASSPVNMTTVYRDEPSIYSYSYCCADPSCDWVIDRLVSPLIAFKCEHRGHNKVIEVVTPEHLNPLRRMTAGKSRDELNQMAAEIVDASGVQTGKTVVAVVEHDRQSQGETTDQLVQAVSEHTQRAPSLTIDGSPAEHQSSSPSVSRTESFATAATTIATLESDPKESDPMRDAVLGHLQANATDDVEDLPDYSATDNVLFKLYARSTPSNPSVSISRALMEELAKFTLAPKPIFSNPLTPGRMKTGRDWLAVNNVHFVAQQYLIPPAISGAQIEFLTRMLDSIQTLKPLPDDIWHVYSLCPGKAMRSKAVGSGRHLHIGLRVPEIDSLGFETLELDIDPGRFGAVCRPLFAFLLPHFKRVYIHSGRPSLHVLFVESLTDLTPKNRENVVFLPWRGFGPFLDGMSFGRKPSPKNVATYIATNLSYHPIYGIDETNASLFEIDTVWQDPGNVLMYSNISASTNYKSLTQNMSFHTIPSERYSGMMTVTRVRESLINHTKHLNLVNYLDPATIVGDTRAHDLGVKASHISGGNVDRWQQINPNTGLRTLRRGALVKESSHPNSHQLNIVISDLVEHGSHLYDPEGPTKCVLNVLKFCLTRAKFNQAQQDLILSSIRLSDFSTDDELIGAFLHCDLNVRVTYSQYARTYTMHDGLIHDLRLTTTIMGVSHVIVTTEPVLQNARAVKNLRAAAPPEVLKILDLQFKPEEFDALLENLNGRLNSTLSDDLLAMKKLAHTRFNGRVDLMMSRGPGIICNGFANVSDRYVTFIGLREGRMYLTLNDKNELEINVGASIGDTTVIKATSLYVRYAIDTFTKLRIPSEHKKIVETTENVGFLTTSCKWQARLKDKSYSATPINPHAQILIINNFDNRNHHTIKMRDVVRGKILTQEIIWVTPQEQKVMDMFNYCGFVRLVIIGGQPHLSAITLGYTGRKLADELNELPYDLQLWESILKSSEKVKWLELDNNLVPQKDVLSYELQQMEVFTSVPALNRVYVKKGEQWVNILKQWVPLWRPNLKESQLYELTFKDCSIHSLLETVADNELKFDNLESWNTYTLSAIGYGKVEMPIYVHDLSQQMVGEKDLNKFAEKEENRKKFDASIDHEKKQAIEGITLINELIFSEIQGPIIETQNAAGDNLLLVGDGALTSCINGDIIEEIVPPSVMNYWNDETAMIGGSVSLPRMNINLRHNENYGIIKEVKKTNMVEYPTHSQPSYTKRATAGLQAVSDLFGTKLTLREVEHDPKVDGKLFVQTYFKEGSLRNLEVSKLNVEECLKWLRERPDGLKITAEVDEILSEGMDVHGLDKVNVHMKMESRLKDFLTTDQDENGMPLTIEEQRVRLIVWQRKGVTAIFAHMFGEIKDKFKRCLKSNIIYTDGLTPMQISAILNNVEGEIVFAEDDLKKQDRQTDMTLIDTELEIYKHLKAESGLIDLWRHVHIHWRAKGVNVKFDGDASRLTGQATTSIGNAIVNLIVKQRLVKKLGKSLVLMLLLGDDNIMICKPPITKKEIELNSARHYNMQSEASVRADHGGFLRMLIYRNNTGRLECAPDLVRLRRRFECLNGVSESTDENVKMRAMSYACMIGSTPELEKLVEQQEWPIKLEKWYDFQALVTQLARKYETSPEDIEGKYNKLVDLMTNRITFERTKLMFTEDR